MRSISTLSAVAVLATASVSAEEVKYLGTPITKDNVVDVMEVQRVVANLTDSADSARWNHVLDLLDDKVDTTIGETEPGVSKVKTNEEIATRWASFFESTDRFVMHHITSNERVFFEDNNNVTVYNKGVITLENTPAGAYAEDGGTLRGYRWVSYEFGLTRKAEGWKVNKVLVDYKMEEFDSLPPKK